MVPGGLAHSYLLRMWREGGEVSAWRFSLENVRDGQRHGFGSLGSLVAFLEREAGEQVQAGAADETPPVPPGDERTTP